MFVDDNLYVFKKTQKKFHNFFVFIYLGHYKI